MEFPGTTFRVVGADPEPHFTNVFIHRNLNLIEISFHSHFDFNVVIATNCVHGMTAVLSWHVLFFLQQSEISIEFELRKKILYP